MHTATGTSADWERPVRHNPMDYNPTPVEYSPNATTFIPTSNYVYNNPSNSGTPNPQYVPQYTQTAIPKYSRLRRALGGGLAPPPDRVHRNVSY